MNHRWISRRHAAVVLAGVVLVNSGLGVTPATADPPIKQSALPSITQNWDKILPSGQRFTVLTEFNNQAVRDNETGLVWERAPLATGFTWFQAIGHCAESTVGGRMGWHLPMVEQMTSLLDPGVTSSPKLSPGHPFQISGASGCCWAATQSPDNPALAYTVDISIAGAAAGVKTGALFTWCVRGGQSLNGN